MTDESNQHDVADHPGAILRAAREEKSLSVEQVAEALHLRASVVSMMEQELYQDFDSDVFLKGYFRSYCRLVGLHEERMIELLDRQLVLLKQGLAEEAAEVKRAKQASQRKKLGRYFAIAAIAVIAVLLLLQSWVPDESVTNDPSNPSSENVEIATGTSEPEPEPERASVASPAETQIVVEDSVLPPISGIEELEAEQAAAEEQKAEVLPESTQSSDSDKDAVEAEPVASEAVLADPDSDLLVIRFTGDCWLKVVNGDGRTVIARLQKAGDVASYTGTLPFNIVLGDARVAEVFYRGEPQNLSGNIRRNGRAELVLE